MPHQASALRSREMIGQAVRIIMERGGYEADEAFDFQRTTSMNSNVKLREIARRTVVSRIGARRERSES
jgi:AmiR/NasT family two-component response regulator